MTKGCFHSGTEAVKKRSQEEDGQTTAAAAHQHILHAGGMSLSADDTAGM